MDALFQDRVGDWPSVVTLDSESDSDSEKEVSVTQTQSSRSNSRDYILFKIHRVTNQADAEDVALCAIITGIFTLL
jgi:hypothetical protein